MFYSYGQEEVLRNIAVSVGWGLSFLSAWIECCTAPEKGGLVKTSSYLLWNLFIKFISKASKTILALLYLDTRWGIKNMI